MCSSRDKKEQDCYAVNSAVKVGKSRLRQRLRRPYVKSYNDRVNVTQ